MTTQIDKLKQAKLNQSKSQQQQSVNQQPEFKEPAPSQIPLGASVLGGEDSAIRQFEEIFNRAAQVVEGLKAADAHNAASVVINEAEDFRQSAEQLAQIIEFYRNPKARLAMAYIQAGKRIAEMEYKPIPRQELKISVPFIELPPAPDFSRFYQSQDLSQPALGDGNSEQSEKTSSIPSTGVEPSAKNSNES